MIALKLWYRLCGVLKILFLKLVYRSNFQHGKALHIRAGFHVNIENNGSLSIGDDVFFNNYCSVNVRSSVSIGSGTIFGENVHIYDHNHRYANPSVPIKEQGYSQMPIRIGSHCWFGTNVVVLKGVTIGDNVVIGAGCVVYEDVPDSTVVVQISNMQTRAIFDVTRG
jgi:acetyltransferase-like isoleucine patch superfamily enzyme